MNITTFRQSPHVYHVSGVKTRVLMSRGSLKIVIKYSFRIDLAHRMREKTGTSLQVWLQISGWR
jgi:hypothetical protein